MHPLVKAFFKQAELEGINLFSIAEITGVSSTCLYAWRNEHRNPSLENFSKAVNALGWYLSIGPIVKDSHET